jgi:hypothetical protein
MRSARSFIRPFDVDRYLDEHREAAPVQSGKLIPMPARNGYGWCGRLNRRILGWQRRYEQACGRIDERFDRWLDRVDWVGFEIRMANFGAVLFVGVIFYLIWKLLEAWLAGRFSFTPGGAL